MKTKRILYDLMMLAALTLAWGCGSSSGDDPYTPEPTHVQKWTKTQGSANWAIDWSSNDSKPSWTAPQPERYETWMILLVTLQPELMPYSTEDDLMAVFIGGEIRALAKPAITVGASKDITFILKVFGNEPSNQNVEYTLSYYCSRLQQTFSLKGSNVFVSEFVYGVDEPFVPDLLSGNNKYPVQMPLTLQMPRTAQDVIQPHTGDLMAVMVGDECRGVATVGDNLFLSPYSLTVYARQEGETGTIYYYNAQDNVIWNTGQTTTITSSAQTINVSF